MSGTPRLFQSTSKAIVPLSRITVLYSSRGLHDYSSYRWSACDEAPERRKKACVKASRLDLPDAGADSSVSSSTPIE